MPFDAGGFLLYLAAAARAGMTRRTRLRQGCGALLCALGVMLALVRRPAT